MLREDNRFKTLCEYARSETLGERRKTPKGRSVSLHELNVRFPDGDERMVRDIETLEHKYGEKGIVNVLNEHVYGEIAILKCLQKDGWEGVWVANFGGILFWDDMPLGKDQELTGDVKFVDLPEPLRKKYTEIQEPRGSRKGGFFDVFAHRDNDFVFMEYKVLDEDPNKNEPSFIDAALDSGLDIHQLIRVRNV
jgi:hypothetical protein